MVNYEWLMMNWENIWLCSPEIFWQFISWESAHAHIRKVHEPKKMQN